MNKGPRKNEWYSDPQDTVTAGWGLCLTGRDLAKLGDLVLHEGQYGGKQIVSDTWIRQMTTPYLKLGQMFGNMEYGYLWYKPYENRPVYAAIGDCVIPLIQLYPDLPFTAARQETVRGFLFLFDCQSMLWYDRSKHRIAAFTFSFLFRLMEET